VSASQVLKSVIELKPRFFEGLASSEVESIISVATRRRFPAHSVITHEGYPAERLFLVTHGWARGFCITRGGEKILVRWFPAGEVFGGAAFLLKPLDYLVSTEAVTDTTALEWDRATIRSLRAQFPQLLENGLLIAYDYFVLYRSLHIAATCHSARQRLAQVLGNLATGLGRQVAEGIELDIRNEELATEANITIFTASRLLSEWQRKGILTKGRVKILLRSPEALMLNND
jgi:CRP/FNR family transcriptional regulator, nitrogen oxide reductase regulator